MDSLRALTSPVKSDSFADDLLAALQSDDFLATADIPGAEPRPSISGEDEAREWEERWEDYCRWEEFLERRCTDPDPYGESLYFGAWGGHSLD